MIIIFLSNFFINSGFFKLSSPENFENNDNLNSYMNYQNYYFHLHKDYLMWKYH